MHLKTGFHYLKWRETLVMHQSIDSRGESGRAGAGIVPPLLALICTIPRPRGLVSRHNALPPGHTSGEDREGPLEHQRPPEAQAGFGIAPLVISSRTIISVITKPKLIGNFSKCAGKYFPKHLCTVLWKYLWSVVYIRERKHFVWTCKCSWLLVRRTTVSRIVCQSLPRL